MLIMDLNSLFIHAVHEHIVVLNFTDPLQRSVRGPSLFYPSLCPSEYLLTMTPIVQDNYVPFFETQIRYFGGLLSSYSLASISRDEEVREVAQILRTKAEQLGEAMLPAFNTDSGLPASSVDTTTCAFPTPSFHSPVLMIVFSGEPNPQAKSQTNLAEIASNQVEYKYLSHLIASSGRPIREAKPYFTKPDHVMDILERCQGKDMTTWAPNPPTAAEAGSEVNLKDSDKYEVEVDTGLWKTGWSSDTGEMEGGGSNLEKRLSNTLIRPPKPNVVQVSIGALGDSAYEYLLKQYLLSGRTEKRLLNMCKGVCICA